MRKALHTEKMTLKKGTWSPGEDQKLMAYINKYRIWNWNEMAKAAGLSRSGKSCRLRWMNYLRPNIRHGNFTKEEEETIFKLQEILGNRWSVIAARLPGRTDNDIKNFWNTNLRKRLKTNQTTATSKWQEVEACGIVGPNPESCDCAPSAANDILGSSLVHSFQSMSLSESLRGQSSFSQDGFHEIGDYGNSNIEHSSLGDSIHLDSFCDDFQDHSLLSTVENQDIYEDDINLSEIFREIESFNGQKFPPEAGVH